MTQKVLLSIAILVLCPLVVLTQESPLASGNIYKIDIKTTGVHRLSYSFFQNVLGINPRSIDLDEINIYSRRGIPLSEQSNQSIDSYLKPISLMAIGLEDGSFDPSDFLLYYAETSGGWVYSDAPQATFSFVQNVYSLTNSVFLRIGVLNDPDWRSPQIQYASLEQKDIENAFPLELYDDFQHHETDSRNLLKEAFNNLGHGSGQDWYGEIFRSSTPQNFVENFDFEQVSFSNPIRVRARFAARGATNKDVTLSIDDNRFTQRVFSVNINNVEAQYARIVDFDETVTLNSVPDRISLQYPVMTSEEAGWLDYITLHLKKQINLSNLRGQKTMRFLAGMDHSHLLISDGTDSKISIWDISSPQHPVALKNNDGAYVVYSNFSPSTLIAFNPDDVEDVSAANQIDNQNLLGLNSCDYLIIAPKLLFPEAQRLLEHRRLYNELQSATIVDIQEIYNEYSSGKCDPTAVRHFLHQLYRRDNSFNYVLLFGDGSFDYRHIYKDYDNENLIPVYETPNSLHPLRSFPSDDYYALLSPNDGENLLGALEIAIGRLPVRNLSEARIMVDKIIRYDTTLTEDLNWLKNITIVADDEDGNIHLEQAEDISNYIEQTSPSNIVRKIYIDTYREEAGTSGNINLEARNVINQTIERGQAIINYIGHGGPEGWASERILRKDDVASWTNRNRLPLFITATCTFAGYDDPTDVSAGEQALLLANGGAVGLFSTVRAVFSRDNARLTRSVFEQIFQQENGQYLPIGEILKRSKNSNARDTSSDNARKFALLGDPLLRLKFGNKNIQITSINGEDIDPRQQDTISALEKITLTGEIQNPNSAKDVLFNGIVDVQVFDKPTTLRTLGQDPRSRAVEFRVQNKTIFQGQTVVTNGTFEISFVVPKDIDYTFGLGKISAIARSNNKELASGEYSNIVVGGTAPESELNTKGPSLSGYIEHEGFVNYDIVPANTIVHIDLYDEQGINTIGQGIGHNIEAILDGNTRDKIILNDFYQGSLDDFRSGTVTFPLNQLSPGDHSLLIRAWDNHNNPSELVMKFQVADRNETPFTNFVIYPNPFQDQTTIQFNQQIGSQPITYTVEIYSMDGRLIDRMTLEDASGSNQQEIQWKGTDHAGNELSKGVYLVRVKAKPTSSEAPSIGSFSSPIHKVVKIY